MIQDSQSPKSLRSEGSDNNTSREKLKRLRQFEEVPLVLQFNKFIRSGYRSGYTYFEALYSILQLHNETGNIWSHLFPAFLLIGAVFFVRNTPFPTDQRIPDLMNALSSLACFLASVSYHTCMACDRHYHYWIKLDVCGIYGLLIGSQLYVFRISFLCHQRLSATIIVLYVIIWITGVCFSLKAKSPLARGLPLLALMLFRLFLLALRLYVGTTNFKAWKFYVLAELLSFIGGVINALRFPECLFKPKIKKFDNQSFLEVGLFDYWFNSHQIMHILVGIAIFLMRYGLASDCHITSLQNICIK